jgi:hypothetical protein
MKYVGIIPLIANAVVEIEADSEDEALEILDMKYHNGEIDFMGFDTDSSSTWWVEEE